MDSPAVPVIDVIKTPIDISQYKGRVPRAQVEQYRKEQEIKYDVTKLSEKINTKKLQQQAEHVKRLEIFFEEFILTGNPTKSIEKVFPRISKLKASALADQYLTELKQAGRLLMEQKGLDFGAMVQHAVEKMKDSKKPDWWDRLMSIAGYGEFAESEKKQGPSVVNIIQTQKEIAQQYVEGEEIVDED